MIATEIYGILTGSTLLSAQVSTNIYYHHLPDNFDLTSNAIVFIINKDESVNSFDGKDELENHTLVIVAVSADTIEIENIISTVETLLVDYSDTTVRDVECTDIGATQDAEKDRYIKTITFGVIYSE